MQYEEFCQRIVRRLDEVLAIRAKHRGAKQALRRKLGVGETFFSDLRRQRYRLPLDKVLRLLSLIEVDGREFLLSVLEEDRQRDLLPPDGEDFDTEATTELARQCFERTGRKGDPARGFWKYKILERMRSEEPRRCVGLVRSAMPFVHRSFLPYLLGVHGSALRVLNQYEQALKAFAVGTELAERLEDLSALANMKQRELHVWFEQGDLERALGLAVEAVNLCELAGDSVGKGRCLVSQGGMLHHSAQFDLSTRALRAALLLLPTVESDYRYSAKLGVAYNFEEIGCLAEARTWALLAASNSQGVSQHLLVAGLTLRGRLCKRLADYRGAARVFQEAFDFFIRTERYLDAAESSIDLCEAHLLAGQTASATATARSSIQLIGHLRGNRVAAAAIAELGRFAASHNSLSLQFLERSRKALQATLRNGAERS